MIDIIPKYEVLYTDLKNLGIGEFLVSRDFKLFMSEINAFKQWKEFYEKVKDSRTYYMFGSDHEQGDATETLAFYMNAIFKGNSIEYLITRIITKFIETRKHQTDFSELVESLKVAQFSTEHITLITDSIKDHAEKSLPEYEAKSKKKIVITQEKSGSKNFKDVFIVHGHNEELKTNVARLLEKLKLNPIILNEQSNEGLTIIEKLEKHANVGFAIVLLTYDDNGNSKKIADSNKRSRQNVILELGYFIGILSRKNVLPLFEDGVELPSDMSGILYTKIDESENWKFRVVKELKTAGFNVDANDIL